MSGAGGGSTSPAVEMRRASVRIDGRLVLAPVDLVIGRGERWILLGPNGGGKTTLLSLAGARRQPSSGVVRVLGVRLGTADIRDLHPRVSHTSHVLTEKMPAGLTVEAVVLTGKRATLAPWFQTFEDADRGRARDLLRQVGCDELVDRPFRATSQGERQRVLLARALYGEPELMILDEPASGLDLPSREALIDALERVANGAVGTTTIVATHHLEEIAPSSTHAALLQDGRIVASGPIEDILTPEGLETCFGVSLEVGHRRGRWWARRRADDSPLNPPTRSRPR